MKHAKTRNAASKRAFEKDRASPEHKAFVRREKRAAKRIFATGPIWPSPEAQAVTELAKAMWQESTGEPWKDALKANRFEYRVAAKTILLALSALR